MKRVENNCVGCTGMGLPCVHCGRDHDYVYYECDSCDKTTLNEDILYEDDGKHYCLECLIKKNMNDFVRYAMEEVGAEWADANFEEVGDGL